ncbi:MAG: DUF342 domain-containing protein [Methylocystaceae bacterium]
MLGDYDRFTIKISPDRMRAYLSANQTVTPEDVFSRLSELGIKHGVNLELIGQVCSQHRKLTNIQIAAGTPSETGKDGTVTYHFHPPEIKPQLTDNDRVNYYELGQVITIKQGQVLAVREPATPGTPGINIMGEPIKAMPGKNINFAFCRGARINGNELIAEIDGALTWQQGKIGVSDLLLINGDVDFSFGNVKHPGKVVVKGFVREGFKVIADDDIEIKGGIVGAQVVSNGGSVIVHGGIIGQGKSLIKAAHNVEARFIQEATVKAGANIVVNEYILRSSLTAQDAVLVQGIKGRIIGDNTIQARSKIQANTIRNSKNLSLEVKGIDRYAFYCKIQDANERLTELDSILRDLSVKLRLLNAQNETGSVHEMRKLLDQYMSLTEEQENLNYQIKTWVQTLRSTRGDGMIEVSDEVGPGMSFRIKNEHLRLDRSFKSITIYYDHKQRKLVILQ